MLAKFSRFTRPDALALEGSYILNTCSVTGYASSRTSLEHAEVSDCTNQSALPSAGLVDQSEMIQRLSHSSSSLPLSAAPEHIQPIEHSNRVSVLSAQLEDQMNGPPPPLPSKVGRPSIHGGQAVMVTTVNGKCPSMKTVSREQVSHFDASSHLLQPWPPLALLLELRL